jgi:hypothetical protein
MDTQLSDLFCLKCYRAHLPVSTMWAGSIVADFDVFEYNMYHFFSRFKFLTMGRVDLQRVEKARCTSIILIITFTAHAANGAI